MSYFNELKKSMNYLSSEGYVFIGQSVRYPGNVIYNTLVDIPDERKVEMPVAEDMQLGISTGMAMNGEKVLSIFPRMDFLMCAMNQLVNHLDKIESMSKGIFRPKVLMRALIGSHVPLDAGEQHTGNYIKMLKELKNVEVWEMNCPEVILYSYMQAVESKKSIILVEYGELYEERKG